MLGIIREATVSAAVDEDYCLTEFGQGLIHYCKLRVENLDEQA